MLLSSRHLLDNQEGANVLDNNPLLSDNEHQDPEKEAENQ